MPTATKKIKAASFAFRALIVTQFLGAFNDNAFKYALQWFVIGSVEDEAIQQQYISIAVAVFTIPFILFSIFAGDLADRIAKRRVIIWTKLWEVLVMGLGIAAFASGSFSFLYIVLFLMGMQSTFFSPAKYGILPESLNDEELSYGNGLIGMTTFLAIILGLVLGGTVYMSFKDNLGSGAGWFVAIALAGLAASWFTPRTPVANPSGPRTPNPLRSFMEDFRIVRNHPILAKTILGIAYFYFLGALFQTCILIYAKNNLGFDPKESAYFQAILAVGIGLGCYFAGRWSSGHVEIGLVPLGAILISVFSILLPLSGDSAIISGFSAMMIGVGGGLFIIPLNALLQLKSPDNAKGRIVAFSNIITYIGIFISAIMLWALTTFFEMNAAQIILLFGIITIAGTVYIILLVPVFFIRFLLWLITHTFYRIDTRQLSNIPKEGPALLISNHVSWVDAILISAAAPRPVRFMMYRPFYHYWLAHWFFEQSQMIPISADDSRKQLNASFEKAAKTLENGEVLLIFAEGQITRTGDLNKFRRGYELIVSKLPKEMKLPIVPLYLGGLWGSVFSYKGGKFLWKWPKRIPYKVSITFGKPMPRETKARDIQEAVTALAET